MSRKPPNLREKLAAAIIQIMDIPHEHAKKMTVDEVLSLAECDHWPVTVDVAQSIGWTPAQYNHPSNLTFLGILEHRTKTATRDVPEIRKSDRISEAHAAFQRRVLAKGDDSAQNVATNGTKPKAKLRSRPFQKAPEGHKHFRRRGQAT